LSDLGLWPHAGTGLAVIGHPIGHSLSPQMHNAALAEMRRTEPRFADWRYNAFDIEPGDLAAALDGMWRLGFRGINLTVPHKVLAVGLVPRLDALASEAGAVNTLVHDGKGWHGTNTDGYGLAAAIREDLGMALKGMPVILLGAGGAARGAAVECLRSGCAGLWILNRTRTNLDSLLAHLAPIAGRTPIGALHLGGAGRELTVGALVINATSAGLRADDPAPVDLAVFRGVAAVFDMIYNPPVTKLLEQARLLRIPHSNGLGMLVHQGAKSLEVWSGVPASATAPTMRAAAAKALGY
jgi:shikimate dehydrogenase